MATLHQKNDGTFCIRHYHEGYSTWQIDGKGIRHLAKRGVPVFSSTTRRDISIPEELFFELVGNDLIYVGGG